MKVVTRLKELVIGLIDRRWYRWHPTVALRYLPVVEEIEKSKSKSKSLVVVEVGSGGLGIAPYLRLKVIGVDRDFGEVTVPWLVKVGGMGERLPLKDKCADWAVVMDVLEHVQEKERVTVVSEAVRISKRWVVIGQPCGELSERQDKELDEIYRMKFGKEHPFLGEHVRNKLPSKEEMREMIGRVVRGQGKEVRRMRVVGNMNLGMRRWLMRGWMTRNPWVDVFFRKMLLLAIPLLRRCNWEPVYGRIWFVELED